MDQINIEIVSIMQEAYMKKDIPLHESLDIKSLLTKMINKFIDIIKNVFAHFNAFLMKMEVGPKSYLHLIYYLIPVPQGLQIFSLDRCRFLYSLRSSLIATSSSHFRDQCMINTITKLTPEAVKDKVKEAIRGKSEAVSYISNPTLV